MTATDVWSQVEVNPTDLRPDDFSETLIEPPHCPLSEIPQETDR